MLVEGLGLPDSMDTGDDDWWERAIRSARRCDGLLSRYAIGHGRSGLESNRDGLLSRYAIRHGPSGLESI